MERLLGWYSISHDSMTYWHTKCVTNQKMATIVAYSGKTKLRCHLPVHGWLRPRARSPLATAPATRRHPSPPTLHRPHSLALATASSLRSCTFIGPRDRLQEKLLLDFHSTAVPGAIAPSPVAFIWVTPASCVSSYSLPFLQHMLNFHLSVAPDRLDVTWVGWGGVPRVGVMSGCR